MLTPPEPDAYARRLQRVCSSRVTLKYVTLTLTLTLMFAHRPQPRIELHAYVVTRMCRVCEVYMRTPPERAGRFAVVLRVRAHTQSISVLSGQRNLAHYTCTKCLKFSRVHPFSVLNALEPPSAPMLTCESLASVRAIISTYLYCVSCVCLTLETLTNPNPKTLIVLV